MKYLERNQKGELVVKGTQIHIKDILHERNHGMSIPEVQAHYADQVSPAVMDKAMREGWDYIIRGLQTPELLAELAT